ncbi:GPR endopeptidase [Candidatus Galacturonibacter soehngenii]|uniref:Germination protease n=1 Tax=Candidatus Galacturonatibacter soehngenii TaxID=2307010 RepID=A0A7V7QNT2_9FIRM|nr:GPR endopeptidase [Candidatus Galacturonibacter soehngenii]KAB1440674.1 GPR endopeptidase [Candidatus Galacturonibacter soehngenii]MBA4688230.1 GPR endopeptidase [Candidatus Galacturonibacter soehngenii]
MQDNKEKEQEIFMVRTDLAVEAKESFEEDNVEIKGVIIDESYKEEQDIKITRVVIENENGAKAMGKPMGNYVTLEAPNMVVPDQDYHREISKELAEQIKKLIPLEKEVSVLIVGLGNREVTPDSLGPNVVENLLITRHVVREYGKEALGKNKVNIISGIVPGVMAQTGMETLEIVKGVVDETKPDYVIAIDALAARSTKRLNRTIQITDTGINPGSGVGNHRNGLNLESLNVPVIAIGIPTVVDAATIVNDTMENLIDAMEQTKELKTIGGTLKTFDANEKYQLIREIISPHLNGMFVTPKDIDETVKMLGFTISEGLNMAFS